MTGFSVMTHITDHWAGWLLEIRRILNPGGLALLSFCGEAMIPVLLDREISINDAGMLVIKYGNPWRFGGPIVMHSPWWIRTHWGQAFEILRLDPAALQGVRTGHDLALLRRPAGPGPTVEQLEMIDLRDPREARGLATTVTQTREELAKLRQAYESAREAALEQRLVAEDRALKLAIVRSSHSWRLTKPLRRIAERLRPTPGWTLDG